MDRDEMMDDRRLIVVRGTPGDTAQDARKLLASYSPEEVCWVCEDADDRYHSVIPRQTRKLLGRSFDAVVLDLHRRYEPDLLGQVHGFIRGGGALVLRLPVLGEAPVNQRHGLDVFPFSCAQVGCRIWCHFERALNRASTSPIEPISVPSGGPEGTGQQAETVDALEEHFLSRDGSVAVLMADRGRGKSSALGMALAKARCARPELTWAVTAGSQQAVGEVLGFAGDRATFIPLSSLLAGDNNYDVIVVDEAAQLPVPTLQRLVDRHRGSQLAFATTTRGYEGTGRGFSLRFLQWLRQGPLEVRQFTMTAPIRWAQGDPLEAFVFDALLLDAQPDRVEDGGASVAQPTALDRDLLMENESLLRGFFGLLVHAHYRTTPGDLWRVLDAPNIRLYAMVEGGAVVAATMVAMEGGLSEELLDVLVSGRGSVRGHALPQSLVSHLGHRLAGAMKMVRSVRIAVHPARRRRGLGSALMHYVHADNEPDIFGTLFGATPEVISFRRKGGYEPVRISASRGARTGEPSVMMVRPVSIAATTLFGILRAEYARDLPMQLALLEGGPSAALEPELRNALLEDLPPAAALCAQTERAQVMDYAFGARTFEAVALSVARFVDLHQEHLESLTPSSRAVIEHRVVARQTWPQVTEAAGLSSPRASMRLLRRAMRRLVELAEPAWVSETPGRDSG